MSHKDRQGPALLWPLLLIGVGTVLLLSNLGLLPENTFQILVQFWPVGLIIIGLDILFGRKSVVGSIITPLLVLGVFGCIIGLIVFTQGQIDFLPEFKPEFSTSARQQSSISVPLEAAETAKVKIDWSSNPAKLYALSDSNNLIDGQVDYYGDLQFDVERDDTHLDIKLDTRRSGLFFLSTTSNDDTVPWEIGLHPTVSLDLVLDASSGSGDYDLRDLQIDSFEIDGGSGPLSIHLPKTGQISGTIDGGSGPITLVLPEQIAARFIIKEGSGKFVPSGRLTQVDDHGDKTIWTTSNFDNAPNSIELKIDGGSGLIEVR